MYSFQTCADHNCRPVEYYKPSSVLYTICIVFFVILFAIFSSLIDHDSLTELHHVYYTSTFTLIYAVITYVALAY